MVDCIVNGILLARQARWDSLGRALRGRHTRIESGDIITGVLIIVGVTVAVWVLSRFLAHQERERPSDKPIRLFRNLCVVHGLGLADTWLLWRVARHQRLRDPARIFLEPERLDPINLGTRFRAKMSVLRGIRTRIFVGLTNVRDNNESDDKEAKGHMSEKPENEPGSPLHPSPTSPKLDVPPWSDPDGPSSDGED